MVLFLTFALLLLISIVPNPVRSETVRGKDFYVYMKLDLKFTSSEKGELELYFGTDHPRQLAEVGNFSTDIERYDNKFLNTIYENFTKHQDSNKTLFATALRSSSGVELRNVRFAMQNSTDYFGLSFSCDFEFPDSDIREYTYLDGFRKLNLGGYDTDELTAALFRNVDRVRIKMSIELTDDLSLGKENDGTYHKRGIREESIDLTTTLTSTSLLSNRFTVDETPLKTPTILFGFISIALTGGIILLAIIWKVNRFRNVGLILPLASFIPGSIMVILFFLPNLSYYGLHGVDIYIWGMIFLSMIGLSKVINPSISIMSFDKEREIERKKRRPRKIEKPRVVYIERIVHKPIREKKEEIDPYEVLGIKRTSDHAKVKKAYLKLVKEYHPDRFNDAPERIRDSATKEMEKINKAYETICEITKKGK